MRAAIRTGVTTCVPPRLSTVAADTFTMVSVAGPVAFVGTDPPFLVVAIDGGWAQVLGLADLRPVARCRVPSDITSLGTARTNIAAGLTNGHVVLLEFRHLTP